jgi:tetratricopeptide (TPR) repeat protein
MEEKQARIDEWNQLNRRVVELYQQGERASAISIAEQALNLARKIFPSPNNDLAASLNNLAELYRSQGRWDDAEHLYDEALPIYRHLFGNQPNNDLAASLNNLAALYESQGRWDDAEPLYDEALAIYRHLFGNQPNNDLAASLNNLAGLHESQGRWDDAEPLYDEALAICRHLFGKQPNNDLATSLNNLAGLYESQGRWDDAEPLYDEALAIRRHLFGNQPNNDLAASLNNLALLYRSQGRWDEAEDYYDEALAIRRHLFGNQPNNDLATSLNNLAALYKSQGRWDEAKDYYDQTLAIRRHLFGKTGHPDLVTSLTNLALETAQQKQPELALPLFQEAIAAENLWLTNVLAINDAEQRLKELDRRQPQIELLLSLTQQYFPNDSEAIAAAFNAVLSRKAQGVTAEAAFSRALRDRPELAPEIEAYRHCQQQIANLVHLLPTQPELQQRFDELLQHRRDLEKNLARSIPAIDLAQQVIDRQALTTLLPDGACLVEFVRYRDFDFIKRELQAARYIAFIVQPQRAGVTAIDCGLAAPLDLAIAKFRHVFADSSFSGERSGFDDMFNQPAPAPQPEDPALPDLLTLLLPHLPTSGTCYLAPDGDLHLLPFHLLKASDGRYLGDRYHLHHLTTARDLYRQKFPTSTNPPAIFADPDYDGGIVPTLAASPKSGMQGSHDVCGEPFDRLPINRILGDAISTAYQVPYYTDIEATVDRLDRLKAPQVLAIATHGFMLPPQQDFIEQLLKCSVDAEEKVLLDRSDEITPEFRDYWHQAAADGKEWCQRILDKIDKIGIHTPAPATLTSNSLDLLGKPATDPMLRSGIALAGANIWRFQGTETEKFGKGVVFAHDIAQWDLWGTELALMITCVSGLGAIENSEGVFGLRRALSIAGAKYVITSLWNIPTKPSVLLMNKFFELYRSADRPTPPQALAQAQNYVRNITLGELKELEIGQSIVEELQGETVRKLSLTATDDVKPLADPHYWGAWICQG